MDDGGLRDVIIEEVRRKSCRTVNDLVDEVSRRVGVSRGHVAYELMVLWRRGLVELEGYPADSRVVYFLGVEGLWYWATLGLVLASIPVVLFVDKGPLIYVRYVLGALMTLFMPGYALVEALYPRGDELRSLERLALSIGLSLAILPLIGLILNYTPWGIRLVPIVVSTSAVSTALLTVAAVEKSSYHMARRGGCFE